MLITSGDKTKSPPSQDSTEMTEIVLKKTYFQRNMTSTNRKKTVSQPPNESGVSINLRFSETMMAMALSSCISFTTGIALTNSFQQSQISNCTLGQSPSTSVLSAPKPSLGKDK